MFIAHSFVSSVDSFWSIVWIMDAIADFNPY